MNRLWVWISVVMVVIILFMVLFPFSYRSITGRPFGEPRHLEDIPLDERDPEVFQEQAEKRFWDNLSRTLAIGAVIALIAGVLLAGWLAAPLRRLEEGAQAIAQHQLDHRIPVRGSVEMRSVARSFNQMVEELEHQELLRRNMLADITHELRHPIHVLQGNLQAILDGVYALDMQEIERMLEQTHTLATLVDDLHELALAESHELLLNKREIDLSALVVNTSEIFQTLAEEKGVRLHVDMPDERVVAQLDADRMRQALGNLLGNALRYTPDEGTISVTLIEAEHNCTIEIRDTGAGISPEDLPKVFDRFYRGDSSRNRNLPGAGLGLPIAQALIVAHGGEIAVESAGIGKGSTFRIKLPLD